MRFSDFAELCYELERTSSRLAKVERAADYLRRLEPDEIRPAVAYLSGRAFPASDPRTLDIGPSAFAHAADTPEITDPPLPALTLRDVGESLAKIAALEGKGSRAQKYTVLRELIEQTSTRERPVLFRLLHGELRIGLHDGLVQEAIARASGADLRSVRRAALFLSDLSEVAAVALIEGGAALKEVDIRLFVPLLPMLSELSEEIDEVLAAHRGTSAFEYKYDGARVQIHREGRVVRIWSRRLTEVTHSIPEIVQIAREEIEADSFILDGEVIAVGKEGRPYPFQELMRRFRRVHGVGSAATEIPLVLCVFDCLLLDGVPLTDEPYEARWKILERIAGGRHLARRLVTSERREVAAFLDHALGAGHEGLMAKALESPYTPGNRGKLWFKIKPAETIDCIITAADRGSGRRQGWLSNYHLGVAGGEGEFAPVGKTFKGLTDAQFTEMTARLQDRKVADDGYTVTVRPEIVVEVAYNEIQRSPQYSSGYALRFARIKRIREDKGAGDITTLTELQSLYERQFLSKSRRDVKVP